MSLWSALRVALGALLVNKGRTALTSLGIVIGTGAVIALVAAGSGARSQLEERLETVGKNLIVIRPGARSTSGAPSDYTPLGSDDAESIRREAGSLLVGVAASQITQRIVTGTSGQWLAQVAGVEPDLQRVRNWQVEAGRFLRTDDLKKMAAVCLVGNTVRKQLFPQHSPVLGAWLRIENLRLRVVGILAEKGRSPTGDDQDNQVFIPLNTFQRRLTGSERVNVILAAVRSEENLAQAKEQISELMRRRHRLKQDAPMDFDISTVQEMAELAQVLTATLQGLVVAIGGISLLVGGVGIMNIMLVSVTERTREIGIRMAIGATGLDVLSQFLLEAVTLALIGGLLGIILGLTAAALLARLAGWPLVVSPVVIGLAFVITGTVGVFFGYYPAWKASRLDPIKALHYE